MSVPNNKTGNIHLNVNGQSNGSYGDDDLVTVSFLPEPTFERTTYIAHQFTNIYLGLRGSHTVIVNWGIY